MKRGKLQTRPGWKCPAENIQETADMETEKVQEVQEETQAEVPTPAAQRKETAKKRRERVPFGGTRLKLSFPEKPGKVRRWVNDVGGRPTLAEQGGYEFVTDDGVQVGTTAVGSGNQDLGSRVSRIVGKNADGSPMRAYLMEIDKDLYDEDQAKKQKPLDAVDDQIRRGVVSGGIGPQDKAYIPTEGITYKP